MKINQTTLTITRGDITELNVEAIVNAAHCEMTMDSGLAAVIRKKGGSEIEEEALSKAPVEPGEAVYTRAGSLNADHVIHTVTLGLDRKANEHIIRKACASSLECAAKLNVQTVVLPALGCGVGQFPVIGSAKIMAQEILKFARFTNSALKEIIICLFDEKTYQTFMATVRGYIDHIQDDLGSGPYVTVDMIIELDDGIVLIERSNPPYGWALPGGFVDYGETLEEAARRETKEETNLDLEDLRQFHTYSSPDRDPRFHTVSTAFIAKGKGSAQFGDDAKGLKVIAYDELLSHPYAFDHLEIIKDYLNQVPRS